MQVVMVTTCSPQDWRYTIYCITPVGTTYSTWGMSSEGDNLQPTALEMHDLLHLDMSAMSYSTKQHHNNIDAAKAPNTTQKIYCLAQRSASAGGGGDTRRPTKT